MDDETTGGNAAPSDTPADARPTTPAEAPAQPSHGDWNAMAKNVREFNQKATQFQALAEQLLATVVTKPTETKKESTTPAPAPDVAALAAELAEMKRTAALKEAYADLGIRPGEARDLIDMAVKAANPQDVRSFVEKYAKAVVVTPAPVAPPKESTEAPPKVPNLGPPGVDTKSHMPDDVLSIPGDVFRGLSPQEMRQKWENYKVSKGGGNPILQKRSKPLIPKKDE